MDAQLLGHWGIDPNVDPLAERPLGTSVVSDHWYCGSSHIEAQERLQFAVDNRLRCAVLSGKSGVGKTALVRRLTNSIPVGAGAVGYLDLRGRTGTDFLEELAVLWGLTPEYDRTNARQWRRIVERLEGCRIANQTALLITDHWEYSSNDVRDLVGRLIRMNSVPLTTVIVQSSVVDSGQQSPIHIEECDLSAEIHPFAIEDIPPFLSTIWPRADQQLPLVDADGIQRLFDFTNGVPSELIRLVRLAFVVGATHEARQLTAPLIDLAAMELRWFDRRPDFELQPQLKAA